MLLKIHLQKMHCERFKINLITKIKVTASQR